MHTVHQKDTFVHNMQLPVCVLLGVQGALTKTPQNVVVLKGQDAVLECSASVSATGQNQIQWNYDNNIVSQTPCTSPSPGFVLTSPNSATDCNIRALGSSEHGISGVYRCTDVSSPFDPSARAVATVTVLGERDISYHVLYEISLYCVKHKSKIWNTNYTILDLVTVHESTSNRKGRKSATTEIARDAEAVMPIQCHSCASRRGIYDFILVLNSNLISVFNRS